MLYLLADDPHITTHVMPSVDSIISLSAEIVSTEVTTDSIAYIFSSTSPQLKQRRSYGLSKPSMWLHDYMVVSKSGRSYPMYQFASYKKLSPSYKFSITAYSAILEPISYEDDSQDPKWIAVM